MGRHPGDARNGIGAANAELAYDAYGDWLASSHFRGELIDERCIALGGAPDAPLRLYRTRQAAAVSDPAVPELTIQLLTAGDFSYSADFGFGRFSGIKRRGQFDITVPDMECRIASTEPSSRPQELLILSVSIKAIRDQWSANGRSFGDFGRLHAQMTGCATITTLMELLWAEAGAQDSQQTLVADGLLLAVTSKLDRLAHGTQAPASKGGLAPWQIRRVTEFLHAHLAENVTLNQLAVLADLSPFHFARAFKQSTGLPPHAFHARLRIDRARLLLENTSLPITDVAAEIGYETPQTLSRLFKRDLGVTPSRYRRERRG